MVERTLLLFNAREPLIYSSNAVPCGGPTVFDTADNVADVTQAHALLHGDETAALGDAGYQGMEKQPENSGKSVTWHVAMKRSKRKALPNKNWDA